MSFPTRRRIRVSPSLHPHLCFVSCNQVEIWFNIITCARRFNRDSFTVSVSELIERIDIDLYRPMERLTHTSFVWTATADSILAKIKERLCERHLYDMTLVGFQTGVLAFSCFNPLPSPKQGETRRRPLHQMSAICSQCFNPLPSPKQGETSIRDKGSFIDPTIPCSFNPLPSPKQGETACDLVRHARYLRLSSFNPLPSPKQGETSGNDRLNLHGVRCFNPLPSPKRGEILSRTSSDFGPSSFNPLPSPKRGEITWAGSVESSSVEGPRVSIRSPHRSEERSARRLSGSDSDIDVSIRSPHRSEERSNGGRDTSTRSRCDQCFNPLPSPKRGEIRRLCCTQEKGELKVVSIRSPHRSEERSRGRPAPVITNFRFNPLPSPKRGEMLVAVTSGKTMGYAGRCAIR